MFKKIMVLLCTVGLGLFAWLVFRTDVVKIPGGLISSYKSYQLDGSWSGFVSACKDEGAISVSEGEHAALGVFIMVETKEEVWCLLKGGAILHFRNMVTLKKCYDFHCIRTINCLQSHCALDHGVDAK